MKGYDLTKAIDKAVRPKGILGSEIKVLDETGYVYDILEVEAEEQPDGKYILWIKTQAADEDG